MYPIFSRMIMMPIKNRIVLPSSSTPSSLSSSFSGIVGSNWAVKMNANERCIMYLGSLSTTSFDEAEVGLWDFRREGA